MDERGKFIEQYALLSPRERNQEYRKFWENLPYNVFSKYNEFEIPESSVVSIPEVSTTEVMQRRENSEGYKTLTGKLNSLLSLSPTTPSFRQFIFDGYKLCYVMGVEEGKDATYAVTPDDTLLWTLDSDNAHNDGIFDPERVEDLERRGYKQLMRSYIFIQDLMRGVMEEEGNQDYDFESDHKEFGDSDQQKRLKQWRKEFMEKYQDEP